MSDDIQELWEMLSDNKIKEAITIFNLEKLKKYALYEVMNLSENECEMLLIMQHSTNIDRAL